MHDSGLWANGNVFVEHWFDEKLEWEEFGLAGDCSVADGSMVARRAGEDETWTYEFSGQVRSPYEWTYESSDWEGHRIPRRCSICIHDRRHEIEQAMLSGGSYRVVAQRYAVSRDAVVRHRRPSSDGSGTGPGSKGGSAWR